MPFNWEAANFYGEYTLQSQILHNLASYIKYAALEVGAYYNIRLNNNASALRPQIIDGFVNYSVWAGSANNWIWEQNIALKFSSGSQPIPISGLYLNNTFYATGTSINGTGFTIDYSRGRVIFSNPVANTNSVKIEHSLRAMQVYTSDNTEYRDIVINWLGRSDVSGINDFNSKVYLPAILIDVTNYKTIKGYELGARTKQTRANIRFDVITTTPYEQNKIVDFLYMMEDKTFISYDLNSAPSPLNISGALSINSSGTWPILTERYPGSLFQFVQNADFNKLKTNLLPINHARLNLGLDIIVSPR